ncbi:MAG: hypothetical protein LJE95_13375, partial [Acidobacteria bacterium]|nr:hypothetical protein [Acidobacteriota bacterium]
MVETLRLVIPLGLAAAAVVVTVGPVRRSGTVVLAFRAGALLGLIASAWDTARHVAYSHWDLEYGWWLWWPLVAGCLAAIYLVARGRQARERPRLQPCSTRRSRAVCASCVTALAV